MKKLIVLPGNSVKNKAWGEAVIEHFASMFDESYMQYYDHWENGQEVIDFEKEAEKLKAEVTTDATDTEYYVFAKSFGSILTMLSVYKDYIQPTKCVFFGIPLNLVEEQNIWEGSWVSLQSFAVPSIAFHNINDPVADYEFTTKVLAAERENVIKVIEKNGDTHAYTELGDYEPAIKDFLSL